MMFGIDSLYVWLAVIIISVAVEAFTLTLCGIWFAAGGDQADLAATFGTLQQFPDYNNAFIELQAGSIDAIAMDIGVANYQVNSRKNPDDYKILDKEISSEQYAVGFKKGNTELKDKVQKTLDEMAEDGTVDKIAEKYADYGVPGALCIGKNGK